MLLDLSAHKSLCTEVKLDSTGDPQAQRLPSWQALCGGPSHNTGLPASVALLLPPNPWPVTLFAEGRKQCASPAGSATRAVM